MISKLFFKLLPIQILLVAMGSINSMIDGAIAGNYIGAEAVGIVGLYYTMVRVLEAINGVLLGGTSVVYGTYMGKGKVERAKGIFSLNMALSFIAGGLISSVSLVAADPLAGALGATPELLEGLKMYIIGYGIGVIPQIYAGQLGLFLQLEHQETRNYIGIVSMIVTNVVCDYLFVAVWGWGMFGLALATSISNWVYFLILVQHYFTSKAQNKFRFDGIEWKESGNIVKTGFPGALLVICLAIRALIINRMLIGISSDALSANSSFNMIIGLVLAFCLGAGAVVRILASAFIGEQDKNSLGELARVVFTKGLLISVLVGAVVVGLSGVIAGMFFPDRSGEAYGMTRELTAIYGCSVPLVLICCVFSNYLQAGGHRLAINIQSVFDGLLGMVIPAFILTPIMGATGIWLSYPIGIALTALIYPIYAVIKKRGIPENFDEWMILPKDFDVAPGDRLNITIRDKSMVTDTSEKIMEFCKNHGIRSRNSYLSALFAEELAVNVIDYGFSADKKKHELYVCVIIRGDDVLLRMRRTSSPLMMTQTYSSCFFLSAEKP